MKHRFTLPAFSLSIACAAVICLSQVRADSNVPPATLPATLPAQAATAPAGETEKIYQAAIDWLDSAPKRTDQMTAAADAVADKLLAGGQIYVAGNGGLRDEMFFRVGGMPFIKPWTGLGQKPGDVIYFSQFVPNEPLDTYERLSTILLGGRVHRNVTIVFASRKWVQISRILDAVPPSQSQGRIFFIDTDAPAGASIQDRCVSEIATTATAWAFQGEVVAAVTRKGKMLATYNSSYEKDPGQTDDSVANMIVNPKYTVPPVEPGTVARMYYKACRDLMAQFQATQGGAVREAARMLAKCMHQGGMVWGVTDLHIYERGTYTPPDMPIDMFGRAFEWNHYAPKLPKGDAVVWLGYIEYPQKRVEAILSRGCEAVAISSKSGPPQPGVVNISTFIPPLDACATIPGYPIHMLPVSGVVESAIWCSLMAETRQVYQQH